MSKQTAVNVLKKHIQDAIEKSFADNHYESGYKQCLIDIQYKIDNELLQMEKEQIEDAQSYAISNADMTNNKGYFDCEKYYKETYGGQDEK